MLETMYSPHQDIHPRCLPVLCRKWRPTPYLMLILFIVFVGSYYKPQYRTNSDPTKYQEIKFWWVKVSPKPSLLPQSASSSHVFHAVGKEPFQKAGP